MLTQNGVPMSRYRAGFSAWVIEACRRRLSTESSGMNYIIK
ncbi:DUF3950 domain-containing protein [Escherichia coli]